MNFNIKALASVLAVGSVVAIQTAYSQDTTTNQQETTKTERTIQTERKTEMDRQGDMAKGSYIPASQVFFMNAHRDHEAEVELAKLGSKRAWNPRVAWLARMIEDDHRKAMETMQSMSWWDNNAYSESNSRMETTTGTNTMRRDRDNNGKDTDQDKDKDKSGNMDRDKSGYNNQTDTMIGMNNTMSLPPSLTMNPSPDPSYSNYGEVYQMLDNRTGSKFDCAWLSTMIRLHQKAIDHMTSLAKYSRDADVRSYALNELPTLRKHLQLAWDLEDSKYGLSGLTGGY